MQHIENKWSMAGPSSSTWIHQKLKGEGRILGIVTFSLSFISSSSWPSAARDTFTGFYHQTNKLKNLGHFRSQCDTLDIQKRKITWVSLLYTWAMTALTACWASWVGQLRKCKIGEECKTWFAKSLLCRSSSQGLEKSRLCLNVFVFSSVKYDDECHLARPVRVRGRVTGSESMMSWRSCSTSWGPTCSKT